MIPEIGHAALWLAAAFALGGALLPMRRCHAETADGFLTPAVSAFALLSLCALLALACAFAVDDFSVALVNDHGHSSRLLHGKLAATWGTPAGALLFWLTAVGVAATLFATTTGNTPLRNRTLRVLAIIAGAGSVLLLLLAPFGRAEIAAVEGRGGLPLLGASYDTARLLFAAGVAAVPAAALIAGRGDAMGARPWLWLTSALLGVTTAFAAYDAPARHGGTSGWMAGLALPATLWIAVTMSVLRLDQRAALPAARLLVGLGVMIAAAGVIVSQALATDIAMPSPGATARPGGIVLRHADVRPAAGPDFTALEARIEGHVRLRPQLQFRLNPPATVQRPATRRSFRGDLRARFDGRRVMLSWQPFAWLVWGGCAVAALGALLCMPKRRGA